MPLAELASKGQAFEQALASIEEQRRITRDLLAGDKRHLLDNLESRIQALREEVSSKLVDTIDQSLAAAAPAAWERTAQRAVLVKPGDPPPVAGIGTSFVFELAATECARRVVPPALLRHQLASDAGNRVDLKRSRSVDDCTFARG
jgi:hypothetical protein